MGLGRNMSVILKVTCSYKGLMVWESLFKFWLTLLVKARYSAFHTDAFPQKWVSLKAPQRAFLARTHAPIHMCPWQSTSNELLYSVAKTLARILLSLFGSVLLSVVLSALLPLKIPLQVTFWISGLFWNIEIPRKTRNKTSHTWSSDFQQGSKTIQKRKGSLSTNVIDKTREPHAEEWN